MPKGSDLLVAALENEGVEQIIGIPWRGKSRRRGVAAHLADRVGPHPARAGGGFMAATHGRLTGRPGVCISTLGPGALNFSTAAAYAHLGAMPMIMITGQKAIMTAKQARFQIVDVIASMRPLTKMARQIVSAASASRRSCAMRSGSRWKSGPGRCIWSFPKTSPETSGRRPSLPLHPIELPVAPPRRARSRGRDDPGGASVR